MKRAFTAIAIVICIVLIAMFAAMAVCAIAQVQIPNSPAGGRALHLTGQHAAVAKDNNSLDDKLQKEFTIEAWIYMDKLPEDDDQWTIIAKPGSYEWSIVGPRHEIVLVGPRQQEYCFAFRIEPGPGHMGIIYGMGTSEIKSDIIKQWHHVAVVADSDRFRWMFDGKHLSGGPYNAIPGSDSEFYVGGRPDRPGSFFRGSIDELRISTAKRYEKEGFELPEERFDSDRHTVGLWHFDEAERKFFNDFGDANILFLRKQGLSIDPSDKLPTEWGLIKDK